MPQPRWLAFSCSLEYRVCTPTIANTALCARTTGCMRPSNIMATRARRPNAGVVNYTKRGSSAGAPIIDGGMNTSIAGIRNAIGMTTITTAIMITTESSSLELWVLTDGPAL